MTNGNGKQQQQQKAITSNIPSDAVTPTQAAKELDASVSSIYRVLHAGKIRSWRKAGFRYLISLGEVKAYFSPVRVEISKEITDKPRTRGEELAVSEAAKQQLREQGWKV